MIRDDVLQRAAGLLNDALLQRMEEGYDPQAQHEFSAGFERKIRNLARRTAARTFFLRAAQCAAGFLLAVFVGGSLLLSFSGEARAAFAGWIKEIRDTFFVYEYEGGALPGAQAAEYALGWVPQGYVKYRRNVTSQGSASVVYRNERGEMLIFRYTHTPEGTAWFTELPGTELQEALVNGAAANLLLSQEEGTSSAMMWTAEDGTAFYLSAYLEEDDLIRLAENVSRTE